jgi:hypothetical protein
MASSSERVATLQEQVREYERIIASFERMNGELQLRRTNASVPIKAFCDRHIALNSRTLETMRKGLEMVKREVEKNSRR